MSRKAPNSLKKKLREEARIDKRNRKAREKREMTAEQRATTREQAAIAREQGAMGTGVGMGSGHGSPGTRKGPGG